LKILVFYGLSFPSLDCQSEHSVPASDCDISGLLKLITGYTWKVSLYFSKSAPLPNCYEAV